MTDAQAALAQVREALAVGPTPGPWHHCQPFQSVRAERTIHGPVPAQRVDFVSTKTQPVHERIIIPMAGREAHVRSEDMAFIAACNPENIAALLAHVEAQEAEIERLTAALQYEQHRADRQGTHGDGCADWGPAHYECAIRERDELRRQLAEAELDARRYRWIAGHCRSTSEHWGGRWSIVVEGPCPAKHDEEGAFDDAIDVAMGLTRPAEES